MLQQRLLANYLLELRGFSSTSDSQNMATAAFVRSMFADEFPNDFLQALIDTAVSLPDGTEVIKQVLEGKQYRRRFGV